MTADAHYEFLAQYLLELCHAIREDAQKNNDEGKEKHASDLQYLEMGIYECSLRAKKVYNRVKPFMNNNPSQP